ncbi:uncharacterized protein [Linepithema humile]|uniref:uncharacterized protein n=1 Tax=Linepithema humile TaxID=83485 RepID=UPI000623A8FE|nr:PREDICTED: uncharacterized protein LOC105671332 [Linepithema humile]XP_012220814.1 PREDICTED: uncharacterized protein LOC105671332 [Linepithema humile]XP_012220815.1 PREDICTED: uncharacterized protein LOC105671332 [Linepithema humile]XP_012220818.1 PREDICTED: uncharacterized protein LOC105671332 [Linepithema humile]
MINTIRTLDQKAESRRYTSSSNNMKTVTHTCVPGAADLPVGESIEDIAESVDELREKLANMKKLMEERRGATLGEISARKRKETSDIIDGNFLSWIFGSALVVILSVSFYAFYNLYHAVLKKFPSHHTEL